MQGTDESGQDSSSFGPVAVLVGKSHTNFGAKRRSSMKRGAELKHGSSLHQCLGYVRIRNIMSRPAVALD
ncbi:hypothetical protein KCU87_g492, partial [Aureobasidium melanogenum]